jgi:glycosyltransferase involved in cell wall biosynthesis
MPQLFFEAEKARNPYSGLGQFARALAEALVATKPKDWGITYAHTPGTPGVVGAKSRMIRRLNKYLPIALSGDIWHASHQIVKYLPLLPSVPVVLTMHDLNFLFHVGYSHPKKERKLARMQRYVDRASAIVYISEYTKKVCEASLDMSKKPSWVIYNGNPMDATQLPIRPDNLKAGVDKDFLLWVGSVDSKKNLWPLVEAMVHLPNIQLVVAGNCENKYGMMCKAQGELLGVADRIHYLGKVSEVEKLWLYKNCSVFVMPSLAEGFGLPVIEAMSQGKTCALSPLGSLPEIGGELCHYMPEDFNGLGVAQAIEAALADSRRESERVAWAARFSWEDAARAYWEVYQEVLDSKRR